MGSMSIVADIVAISCMCGSPFSEWVVMVLGWATRNCCHLFIAQQIKLISIFDTERHRPLLTATVCHWHSWVSNALFFDLPFPISPGSTSFFPLKGPKFSQCEDFRIKIHEQPQSTTYKFHFVHFPGCRGLNKKKELQAADSL